MKNAQKFQDNLSRPGIIDARARYRAADRRLRNTDVKPQQISGNPLSCDVVNQQMEHIFIQFHCLYMFTQLKPFNAQR